MKPTHLSTPLYRLVLVAGLALIPSAVVAQSAPRPPVQSPSVPSSAELQALRERIEATRRADAAPFTRLDGLRAEVARMDRERRGRWAPTMPLFRALGPDALLPMLDALLRDAPLTGARDAAMARRSWRVGMLQALIELRDPTARPVLMAILDAEGEPDDLVRRTAAEALGALGADRDVAALRARMGRPGPTGLAAIAGLGHARRADSARLLADALVAALGAAEIDQARVEALIAALGRVGNAFAWRLPHLRDRPDADRTRDIAAAALLEAYVGLDGDGADAARRAFLVVDAPSAAELLVRARARHPRAAVALDALARRMARHPLRRAR